MPATTFPRVAAWCAVVTAFCLLPTTVTYGQVTLDNGDVFNVAPGVLSQNPNALLHIGYHSDLPRNTNNNGATVQQHNLHLNGGHMNGASPTLTGLGWDFGPAPLNHPNVFGIDELVNGPGNRGLDFNNDGDFTSTAAIGRGDDYQNMWLGTLTVSGADAGNWTFRRNSDDDRFAIWLDLDQDGIFESSDGVLGNTGGTNTNGELLAFENNGTKTVNLAAGDYLFAAGHTEFGGGSNIDIRISTPNLAEERIKPGDADQNGFWSYTEIAPTAIGNVTVNGDSTIGLSSGVSTANAGTLNFANTQDDPSTLTVNSVDMGQGLTFSDMTTLNSNGGIFDLVNMPVVTLQGQVTGPGDLEVMGPGQLILEGNNNYTGTTTIGAGSALEIQHANGLGTTGSGTTVENGGALRLANGGNFNISEPLFIEGDGNAKSNGALRSQGNDHDINGLVTLTGDATITKGGGGSLEFRGGGSGGIVLGANQLTIENDNTIRIFNNGISGTGDLVKQNGSGALEIRTNNGGFSGTVNILDGFIDVDDRTNPLGPALSMSAATALYGCETASTPVISTTTSTSAPTAKAPTARFATRTTRTRSAAISLRPTTPRASTATAER